MNDREVFLSYAREDQARVKQILEALLKRGFPVFFDREMISGVEWEKVLESRLQDAYAVVVVWSSHSVKKATQESGWILREATIGLEKGRLFPIQIESGLTIPEPFKHIQAAHLSEWNPDVNDSEFDRKISLLRALWVSEQGLLKDEKVWRIRLKTRTDT